MPSRPRLFVVVAASIAPLAMASCDDHSCFEASASSLVFVEFADVRWRLIELCVDETCVSPPTDTVAGAWPLANRVTHRACRRWLLAGDAAGFLDPFTGEGLYRSLASAELAAAAIHATLRGSSRAFAAYERAMQRRFLAKDGVSWLVQAFLTRPALFEYAARRVAARPPVRATMGLVMGDLVPASRALDPRYLAALLAP